MAPEKLGTAGLVAEESLGGHKVVKITGVSDPGKTLSILVRGSNKLVLEEAERSLHDALCVVRSLVKKRYLIRGAALPCCAPEGPQHPLAPDHQAAGHRPSPP